MKYLILVPITLCFLNTSCSKETGLEKAEVEVNSIERGMKKSKNRVSEAFCGKTTGDNEVECLAKKIKNRATESKDAIVDKASEVKNKVDE